MAPAPSGWPELAPVAVGDESGDQFSIGVAKEMKTCALGGCIVLERPQEGRLDRARVEPAATGASPADRFEWRKTGLHGEVSYRRPRQQPRLAAFRQLGDAQSEAGVGDRHAHADDETAARSRRSTSSAAQRSPAEPVGEPVAWQAVAMLRR